MNLEKQEELSVSPDLAVALSPTGAVEGQLERLISEVNHLNTYLMQSVSRFGEHVQNYGDRLTNLENRLWSVEGQKSGCESVNGRPESEAQETKSEVSNAGSGSEASTSGRALEDKLDHLISKVNQLNAFMGTVAQSVASFKGRIQSVENTIQDQNRRLKDHDSRLELHISTSAEREEVMAKLVESAVKEDEPSVEEAVHLLPSARRLGMKSLVEKLVDALTDALAEDNCVAIFQLASLCQLDELLDDSFDMICKNFVELSETCKDFCKLSLEEVSQFVFSDSVRATEEQVFEAIVQWIKADESKRRSLLSELLPAVRVGRCSSRFLKQMLDHFLVQDQHLFRTSALERIQWMTSTGLSEVDLVTRNRYQTEDRDLLFVMGGYNSEGVVETLDPEVAQDSRRS